MLNVVLSLEIYFCSLVICSILLLAFSSIFPIVFGSIYLLAVASIVSRASGSIFLLAIILLFSSFLLIGI